MERPKILGILNITEDSFSDGGKYLKPSSAMEHALHLIDSGADILDLGAQSSNPQSMPLSWEVEWERLRTIIELLRSEENKSNSDLKFKISIDSFRPQVLENCLKLGIDYWNDITALKDPLSWEILTSHKQNIPNLILMFSHNRGDRAVAQSNLSPKNIVDQILKFFDLELKKLTKVGIAQEKIIIDPGMGFFLGDDPQLSTTVIQNIPRLKKELGKILISVSRKSFLGNILGGLPPEKRNHATLAAELYVANSGVDFIRTHEPQPLMQGLKIWSELNS
jgi:dihydropteroate synthase